MRRILALVLLAGLVAPTIHARPWKLATEQPATGSVSVEARCASDFVAMVNDPTPERIRAFETAWGSQSRLEKTPIDERISRVKALHDEWGKITVSGAAKSRVIAATTGSGLWLQLNFNMSATEPGKLDAIDVEASTSPFESRPLTTEARDEAVKGVADALRKGYVYPDKGAQMADAILGKLKAGDYDRIGSESALAKQLTDDCRAITHDRHLGIRVAPEEKSAKASEIVGGPSHDEMRRENYAFKKAEILPGNIGYLRFDAFIEDKEANRVASNAMNFLSGCDALIFDVRSNGGGSPAMIQYITSYLFDSKTHLNDMVDRDGKIVEEYWTLPEVPGPRPKSGIPVFVLASSRTFSGAEEFCYNLQNLKRATLVGETTGGGAHPVEDERVNDRFVVRVPFMRAQNPITKTNWEGTGVEPDVKCNASEALDKAVTLAREATASTKK